MRHNAKFWKAAYERATANSRLLEEQKREQRTEALELLSRIYKMHSPYVDPGEVGSAHSVRVWCSDCRHPWPCATATALINYDEIHPRAYQPMTLMPVEREAGESA